MVLRKKNLLDAFREAAPEGRKAHELSPSPTSPAGGPFAASARASPIDKAGEPAKTSSAPPARPPDPRPDVDFEIPAGPSMFRAALADKALRAVVLIASLVALAAFLVGRFGNDPAQAAETAAPAASGPGLLGRGGEAAPAGRDLAQKNRAAAKMGSEDDRAFMDPANKYTIRLIQYDSSEANLERAHATAEHLRRKEGVPVVGPISMGNVLVLAVGHTPRIADLDPLLKHVKGLSGPPPQDKGKPFASAYVVNIDDVVKRD